MFGRGYINSMGLMRRLLGGDEDDAVEPAGFGHGPGADQMREVNGIKATSEADACQGFGYLHGVMVHRLPRSTQTGLVLESPPASKGMCLKACLSDGGRGESLWTARNARLKRMFQYFWNTPQTS